MRGCVGADCRQYDATPGWVGAVSARHGAEEFHVPPPWCIRRNAAQLVVG
jgi:hypothetical protein